MSTDRLRPLPLLLAALLYAGAPGPLHADNDDRGKMAGLVRNPLQTGGRFRLTLRSTEVGRPAALALSLGRGPLVGPGHTVLYLDPGFFFLKLGFINPSGRLEFDAPVPGGFSGIEFFAQGLVLPVLGPLRGSNPVVCKIDPIASASFVNRSVQLPPSSLGAPSTDADAVDIDGDGDLDLIVATTLGVAIYRNDGSGQFIDETSARIDFNLPAEIIECGDVDMDGDLDLFVSGATQLLTDPPAPNRLFRNDGAGHFIRDLSFPAGAGLCNDAEFGDVDGDGDQDLVLANLDDPLNVGELPDPDLLLINQGRLQGGVLGQFVAAPAFSAAAFNDPAWISNDVSLGDIDNDGDLDLFVARIELMVGRPNLLLRNDGVGGFADISSTHLSPLYADDTFEAEFADVNGDGLLDLVIAQSLASVFGATLMINQGGGLFVEDSAGFPQLVAEGELIRLGLDVGDVDNDGDIDVLMAVHFELASGGGTTGKSLLFLNQGGIQAGVLGTFAVDASFPAVGPFVTPDALLFDMDLDADLDALIVNRGDIHGIVLQDVLLRNDLP